MMPQFAWAALLAAILVLCAVYLWSRDEGRRERALRLLRLILGRRLASRLDDRAPTDHGRQGRARRRVAAAARVRHDRRVGGRAGRSPEE